RIEVRGNDEFAELARGFNGMADAIEQRDKRLAEADQEKGELLRSIYPAGVAERLRSGAEITAETVPNITVVVAWVDGLDTLSANRSAGEVRAMLNQLLDTLHSTAATHGVELLRSLGESYIGVCGLSSPRLDHATRTLAWARTASLAVQRLTDDWANNVSLRFGLASGEIDVLLMGRGHTAYDIWGRTLSVCRLIAVEAQRGCVRLSEGTYSLLTNVDGFEPCPPIVTVAFGAVNSWSRPVIEKAPVDIAVLAEAQPARVTE
ncbi:MAG: adenylate/guanylate cyclase domain-containing protein, partial [Verrucomicrobia bacterium]|nr:adenylate/guanylate cyclase domain-containing protein [Verrucomicrobiota bacterium]